MNTEQQIQREIAEMDNLLSQRGELQSRIDQTITEITNVEAERAAACRVAEEELATLAMSSDSPPPDLTKSESRVRELDRKHRFLELRLQRLKAEVVKFDEGIFGRLSAAHEVLDQAGREAWQAALQDYRTAARAVIDATRMLLTARLAFDVNGLELNGRMSANFLTIGDPCGEAGYSASSARMFVREECKEGAAGRTYEAVRALHESIAEAEARSGLDYRQRKEHGPKTQ